MGLLAIYVIALTTILSAVGSSGLAAGPAFDPFSVICHSGPQDASQAEKGPAAPASLPNHACDHCSLCSATPTAAATLDSAIVAYLTPVKLDRIFPPAIVVRRDDIGGSPRQAQGPPSAT